MRILSDNSLKMPRTLQSFSAGLLKPGTCLPPDVQRSELLDTFYLLAWLLPLLELNNFILTLQNLGQPTCSLNKRGLFNAEHCSFLTKYLVCNYTFMRASRWLNGKEPACQCRRPKRLPVRSLGWEDALEWCMTTHSSILAWRIPWTEELGRLQSIGSQRVGYLKRLSLSTLR